MNNSSLWLPPPATFERQKKLVTPLDVPLVHTLYDAYALWHGLALKFPKAERYSLAQSCGNSLLTALEYVLAAAATADRPMKLRYLQQANAKLDVTRLLVRLAKDCKCLPNNQYLTAESRLHEAGKMLGGWIKSLN